MAGNRCCPKGPTCQGSAPRTAEAFGDTQAPGGHPSPTAASRAGPLSDHEGGTGRRAGPEGGAPAGGPGGRSPPSLSVQGARKVLAVVLAVLKGGPDWESGAGAGSGEDGGAARGTGYSAQNNCPGPFTGPEDGPQPGTQASAPEAGHWVGLARRASRGSAGHRAKGGTGSASGCLL